MLHRGFPRTLGEGTPRACMFSNKKLTMMGNSTVPPSAPVLSSSAPWPLLPPSALPAWPPLSPDPASATVPAQHPVGQHRDAKIVSRISTQEDAQLYGAHGKWRWGILRWVLSDQALLNAHCKIQARSRSQARASGLVMSSGAGKHHHE
jgi:hypothetical protein